MALRALSLARTIVEPCLRGVWLGVRCWQPQSLVELPFAQWLGLEAAYGPTRMQPHCVLVPARPSIGLSAPLRWRGRLLRIVLGQLQPLVTSKSAEVRPAEVRACFGWPLYLIRCPVQLLTKSTLCRHRAASFVVALRSARPGRARPSGLSPPPKSLALSAH